MPRTVNNSFTTHGKDVLSSGAERVNRCVRTDHCAAAPPVVGRQSKMIK